jgi:folate-binding protein YgfZ
MIHLPYLSAKRFSGPDAGSFLHAQLSADIAALEEGQSTFAAYCSPQGKVFGLLLIGRQEDNYMVVGSAQLLPSIVQRLRIYIFRSKVEIEQLDNMQICGVLPSDPYDPSSPVLAPGNMPLRYTIDSGGTQNNEATSRWRQSELSHGVVWLDANTTEKYIPQMLGYDQMGAVSYAKGCYPGQEIVARAHYLGKVKRKPLLTTITGQAVIENGSRVQIQYETETVDGTLVDTAPAGTENTLMFIVTRVEDEKKPVSITHEGQSYPSTIQC